MLSAGVGPLLAELPQEHSQPSAFCCSPQSEGPYDVILPRATNASSASSTLRAEDAFAVQARHAAAQRDARGSQVG